MYINIDAIDSNSDLWIKLINFAENCSWNLAGRNLAKKLRLNMFDDNERVIIAHNDSKIIGYCTLTNKDSIPDVEYTPFIGFVFVEKEYRGNRISQRLIDKACELALEIGFDGVYLASQEKGLYEKYGFKKIDEKKSKWGSFEQIFYKKFNI